MKLAQAARMSHHVRAVCGCPLFLTQPLKIMIDNDHVSAVVHLRVL